MRWHQSACPGKYFLPPPPVSRFSPPSVLLFPLARMVVRLGLIRTMTLRLAFVRRGGMARGGRVAGRRMMLGLGSLPLLTGHRLVFDALLHGFSMRVFW
jgi:hypothetical protein